MTDLRKAAQQALEALEWAWGGEPLTGKEMVAIAALRAALAEPQTTHWEGCEAVHPECRKPEPPVATKQMLRWVEHLKRLSDDGQHMSIPGLSSGACWELAIELEQFIKNTAPTPRKPLSDEQIALIVGECAASAYQHDDFSFARAIERAHGIGEQHE